MGAGRALVGALALRSGQLGKLPEDPFQPEASSKHGSQQVPGGALVARCHDAGNVGRRAKAEQGSPPAPQTAPVGSP